jgi:hypothetical protein
VHALGGRTGAIGKPATIRADPPPDAHTATPKEVPAPTEPSPTAAAPATTGTPDPNPASTEPKTGTAEQPKNEREPHQAEPLAPRRLRADEITRGMELDPTQAQVFRGGSSFTLKPNEAHVDKPSGLVKPTHGPSLETNPDALHRFGGPRRIRGIPKELKIIQRGSRIEHFEIVPREPMTETRFQELLNQIELDE